MAAVVFSPVAMFNTDKPEFLSNLSTDQQLSYDALLMTSILLGLNNSAKSLARVASSFAYAVRVWLLAQEISMVNCVLSTSLKN